MSWGAMRERTVVALLRVSAWMLRRVEKITGTRTLADELAERQQQTPLREPEA